MKRDLPRSNRLNGRFGQRRHLHEPLPGNEGFDDRPGPARHGDRAFHGLRFDEEPLRLQIRHDAVAGGKTIHTLVRSPLLVDCPVGPDHIKNLEAVPPPDLEIVPVVARRHLQRPAAEIHLDILVRNHRNFPTRKRKRHFLSDEVGITRIVGVYGDRRIPQHRFRAGRGDRNRAGTVRQRIIDIPQMSFPLHIVHFLVRQRRPVFRIPVDQVIPPIDQPFFIQTHEHFLHRSREALVHRKPLSAPVARVSETTFLFQNPAAVFALPRPNAFDETLAAQIMAGFALFGQLLLHDILRGNAGMIHARHPERFVALHAPEARHGVLNSILQRMPHMQRTGHIGGRHDNDMRRLAGMRPDPEEVVPFPPGIPFGFDLGRAIRRTAVDLLLAGRFLRRHRCFGQIKCSVRPRNIRPEYTFFSLLVYSSVRPDPATSAS